jgi:hypothetical protein
MKTVVLVNTLSLLASAVALGLVLAHHRDLTILRTQLAARQAHPTDAGTATASPHLVQSSPAEGLNGAAKHELLRLRAEVTRLRQRQRELAAEKAEHENLNAAVAKSQARGDGVPIDLPPGYLRRNKARFVGASTPEDALQSLFWAIENRNTNLLIPLVDGTTAREFRQVIEKTGMEQFWNETGKIPGFRVVGRESLEDAGVKLKVEIVPYGDPVDILARQSGTNWRIQF